MTFDPTPTLSSLLGNAMRQFAGDDRVLIYDGERRIAGVDFARYVCDVSRTIRTEVVTPTRVAIVMSRSVEAVGSLWATLALGHQAVPVDPTSPARRVEAALASCEIVLGDGGASTVGSSRNLVAVPYGADSLGTSDVLDAVSVAPHPVMVQTSGTTGGARLIALSANSLMNRIAWSKVAQAIDQDDCVLLSASPSFDYWVWEALAPLAFGSTVVVAPNPSSAASLASLLSGCTVCHFVPSVFRLVRREVSGSFPLMRVVYFGGEMLTGALLQDALELFPTAAIYNQYGPAEMTIDTHSYRCTPEDVSSSSVPIGFPIEGVDERVDVSVSAEVPTYLGDGNRRSGELLILGLPTENLLEDPGMPTVSPVSADGFRTGDVVSRRGDGALVFVRRFDDQLKNLGVRFHLGEVERAAMSHPLVDNAVAAVLEDGVLGLAVESAHGGLRVNVLRSALMRTLHRATIPPIVAVVAKMPTLDSGKIDKRGVTDLLESTRRLTGHDVQGDFSNAASEIWRRMLEVETLHSKSNFFSLGGDSLMAADVTFHLSDVIGIEVPLNLIFEYPEFGEFVDQLNSVRRDEGSADDVVL